MNELTPSEIELIKIIKKYRKLVKILIDDRSQDHEIVSAQRELEEMQDQVIVVVRS